MVKSPLPESSPRSGPSNEIRVILLHPSSWSDVEIDLATEALREYATAAASESPDPRIRSAALRVVAARDDWQAHVRTPRPGDRVWAAWVRDVAVGVQRDGQPSYHTYVVPWGDLGPKGPVGKATSQVIGLALRTGKPVLSWNPDDRRSTTVTGVGIHNGQGFVLEVGSSFTPNASASPSSPP